MCHIVQSFFFFTIVNLNRKCFVFLALGLFTCDVRKNSNPLTLLPLCQKSLIARPKPASMGFPDVVRPSVCKNVSTLVCVLSYTANLHWNSNIFADSGPPIKWPLWGLIRGAPNLPNPPYRGWGQNIFWGYDWWTIQTPIESNICGKLLTQT